MTLIDSTVASDLAALIARKGGEQIAVCIPARDEAATIGDVVAAVFERVEMPPVRQGAQP